MNRAEIYARLNNFAPQELAEMWDCCGAVVETDKTEIRKIMLALTVTDDVINQAQEQNCDIIISHHPLFYVPLWYRDMNIFCAHTNLDKTKGGTTDTLIETLGFSADKKFTEGFLRYVSAETSVSNFIKKLKKISPNLRYVNNFGVEKLHKIAFCAGSGSDFIQEAYENGADALVTGDLKFHTALESPIVTFDIGHFESEILVLHVFEKIIGSDIEIIYAKERSPFTY